MKKKVKNYCIITINYSIIFVGKKINSRILSKCSSVLVFILRWTLGVEMCGRLTKGGITWLLFQ